MNDKCKNINYLLVGLTAAEALLNLTNKYKSWLLYGYFLIEVYKNVCSGFSEVVELHVYKFKSFA